MTVLENQLHIDKLKQRLSRIEARIKVEAGRGTVRLVPPLRRKTIKTIKEV